jgi:hypothetical protein
MPDNEGVRHIVELLKNISDKQGNGKGNDKQGGVADG